VNRVVLRHEGHSGSLVVGSTNVGAGTFQFNSNGLAGVLFNEPVTVLHAVYGVSRRAYRIDPPFAKGAKDGPPKMYLGLDRDCCCDPR
jgi:hypothetical protein